MPKADEPDFVIGDLPVPSARACGWPADNLLDVAPFTFMHVWTFAGAEVRGFEVIREHGAPAVTARYEHLFANREDAAARAGERPVVPTRRLTYSLVAPFHQCPRRDFVDAVGTTTIGCFLQPATVDRCCIFSAIWRNDLGTDRSDSEEAIDIEVKVVDEGLLIQASRENLSLSLDRTAELHTRTDRTAVELRRVLADLVAAS
ncbi:MAG: hypothetical protein ACYCSF_08085 [Acidimicrobiales bacterium]